MFQRLEDVEKRYDELTVKISDPNEIANTRKLAEAYERTCRACTSCRKI